VNQDTDYNVVVGSNLLKRNIILIVFDLCTRFIECFIC